MSSFTLEELGGRSQLSASCLTPPIPTVTPHRDRDDWLEPKFPRTALALLVCELNE